MIIIKEDIDLIDDVELYDVVLVGTNTYITMGNGFQKKIKDLYPQVYSVNLRTKYGDKNKLGTHCVCKINDTVFCLCFITHSYNFRPDLKTDYLDYEALKKCLININYLFMGKNIATTLIGCSNWDGNGDRDKVLNLMNEYLTNCNVTIYDYHQPNYKDVEKKEWEALKELKEVDRKSYYDKIKQRKIKKNEQGKNRNYFRE